ncbi:MAG: histidine phosphatase family protein [Chloroflexaceae bacterium]|nr:histidine phosphatase family protein [Chloroflexaceae bacterium]
MRHGQTLYNLQRRYQSYSDTPLTEHGQRQAAALAHRLRRIPFTVALVSPVERARATAAHLLAGREVPQLEAPGWAETNHGRWEGLTYREVLARFPGEAQARWGQGIHGRAQGGESLAEVVERVGAAWADLLRRYPGGRVLVVTHATPIQLLLCAISGMPPANHWQWRVDQGSLTSLDVYATGTIMRMVNEVPRP